jgi:hypothetical protein
VGRILTARVTSTTATVTSVAAAVVSTPLVLANSSRQGVIVYNDSPERLYVKCGVGASLTSFTALVRQGDYWELPFGYLGDIEGIWTAAGGFARVTEFT